MRKDKGKRFPATKSARMILLVVQLFHIYNTCRPLILILVLSPFPVKKRFSFDKSALGFGRLSVAHSLLP